MGRHSAVEPGVGRHRADLLFDLVADEAEGTETERMEVQAELLTNAYGLLGDGQGSEWDENNEYTRGVFELIANQLGIDVDHRSYVPMIIKMAAGQRTPALIDWMIEAVKGGPYL